MIEGLNGWLEVNDAPRLVSERPKVSMRGYAAGIVSGARGFGDLHCNLSMASRILIKHFVEVSEALYSIIGR
jgi:hypothetical protein